MLRPVRPSLALAGFAGATGLALTSPAVARDQQNLVGVRAWTSGSQTYIRTRPSAETPPVAKVAKHTQLYVWGKFNGWYRVETHDHIFGWVHNEYISSPDIHKVRELSHTKARLASEQSSQQTMYGTPAELKAYYARFGGSGALKGLKQHGITLVKEPVARPKAKPKTYIAARPAAPAPVVQPRPVSPVKRAPVTAPTAPSVPVSEPTPATLAGAPIPAPVESPTSAPETGDNGAPSRVSELGAGLLAKVPDNKSVGSLLTTKPQVAPPPVITPRVVTPRAVTPRTAPLGGAPVAMKAAPPKAAPPKVIPVMQGPAPKTWAQKNAEAKAARAKMLANQAAAAKAARIAKWKNQQAWKQKQHEKRLAALEYKRKMRLASRSKQREMLGAKVGLLPKGQPPVANKGGAGGAVAPLSPEDLMKARDAFLTNRKNKWGNSNEEHTTPNAAAPTESGSPLAPASPAQINPTAYYTLPQGSQATPAVLLGGLSPQLASRSGDRNRLMLVDAPRGGSPRDRFTALAQANHNMAIKALSYRGMPYIFGASSPQRGFDCSGLVYFLLRQRGYNPPRTAAGYRNYGTKVERGQWQPGDLILFANTYKRGISHIGIYLGNNKFVHAATSGRGVRVDSLNAAYYARKYWGARRVK